ncbi:FMRF-Like Peptide [Caenorhabditis elegans]|uniref:FMRF-Like Peptide n=1 Tax=Caenorhabditis elegans TaxID=6239 RepID=Q95QP2_CAEEL|nr:FMRF-Like Peptide [Caenorhabditis elegans]CCD65290.1 FMRF-Like Peptide [Caenorhabditis elegans]|eukprot:NP_509574.2 FMRF-Like Peptide [Caenorhabditis elegans]
MLGYTQSRVVITLLLFSVFLAVCMATPSGYPGQELQNVSDDYPIYEEEGLQLSAEGTDEPHEEKRAVFRMGKRAMMRFGKRAMMRFGKRSVFRLG